MIDRGEHHSERGYAGLLVPPALAVGFFSCGLLNADFEAAGLPSLPLLTCFSVAGDTDLSSDVQKFLYFIKYRPQ